MSREQKLEALLASAVHLLDSWEDISAKTGEEPEDYGEQRAILQAEYDAIRFMHVKTGKMDLI